jgi:hypothetical protein
MGEMVKRAKKKARLGAWLPANMAAAVDEWLARHPGKHRTDFLIEATSEQLKKDGVLLPDAVLAVRSEPKAVRRGGKVLIASWVDQRILAGIDVWREQNPHINRSLFVINSVAAKLRESGVDVRGEASSVERRLPKEAYKGIRLELSPAINPEKVSPGGNPEKAHPIYNAEVDSLQIAISVAITQMVRDFSPRLSLQALRARDRLTAEEYQRAFKADMDEFEARVRKTQGLIERLIILKKRG